jgi:hypothetical protein
VKGAVRRWARSMAAGAFNAGGARCGDVSGGRGREGAWAVRGVLMRSSWCGEEAWGRRDGAREAACRRGQGGRRGGLGHRRWKTHLTGGSHLSARGRDRRGRGGPRELLGRRGMGRRWEERREGSGPRGPDGDGFAFLFFLFQILFNTNLLHL